MWLEYDNNLPHELPGGFLYNQEVYSLVPLEHDDRQPVTFCTHGVVRGKTSWRGGYLEISFDSASDGNWDSHAGYLTTDSDCLVCACENSPWLESFELREATNVTEVLDSSS